MTVGVGVIGTGNIGTAHARNLAFAVSRSQVSAVFNTNATQMAEVAGEIGAIAVSSVDERINHLDAAVTASPDHLHAQQRIACLAAGKPTMCEKPLAPSIEEAITVLNAEVTLGKRLITMGFVHRFDAGYVDLKEQLGSGTVGMAGSSTACTAIGALGPRSTSGVRDPQLVFLHAASGMIVKVELFGNAQVDYEVTCEVVGSKGTLRLGNGSGALLWPTDRRCRHGSTALEQFMARGSLRYREPGPPSQQLTPKASRASPDPQREAGEESSLATWVLTDPDSVVDLLEPLAVLRTQAPD